MRRLALALPVLFVAVVAMVSSACSVVDPPALQAGDVTLRRKDFLSELDALLQAPQLLDQLGVARPPSSVGSPGTTRPSTYDTTFTAAVLNLHLRFVVFDTLAQQYGISPDATEEARAASEVDALIGTSDTFKSGPGEQFRNDLIRMFVLFPHVQAKLAEGIDYRAQAREFYEARKDSLPQQTCLGLLAFVEVPVDAEGRLERQPTPEEMATSQRRAQEVYGQLIGGADFDTIARGPENADELRSRAGDLGCVTASDLQANLPPAMVAAIDATPPGGVTEPLDAGFGYEIFKVKSRGIPSFEGLETEIVQSLVEQDGQRLLNEKLLEIIRDLDVKVDPLFGVLDEQSGLIVPPDGADAPPATLTPSTIRVESSPSPHSDEPQSPDAQEGPGGPVPGDSAGVSDHG